MKSDDRIRWWGYLHVNDSVIVKRYLNEEDRQDALRSDLVVTVTPNFLAIDREAAQAKANLLLKGV